MQDTLPTRRSDIALSLHQGLSPPGDCRKPVHPSPSQSHLSESTGRTVQTAILPSLTGQSCASCLTLKRGKPESSFFHGHFPEA